MEAVGKRFAHDLWISVRQLAGDVGVTERTVYGAIYDGSLRHSRQGRRIRVRKQDWFAMHEGNIVEAGEYEPDPARQQEAIQRAERRGSSK